MFVASTSLCTDSVATLSLVQSFCYTPTVSWICWSQVWYFSVHLPPGLWYYLFAALCGWYCSDFKWLFPPPHHLCLAAIILHERPWYSVPLSGNFSPATLCWFVLVLATNTMSISSKVLAWLTARCAALLLILTPNCLQRMALPLVILHYRSLAGPFNTFLSLDWTLLMLSSRCVFMCMTLLSLTYLLSSIFFATFRALSTTDSIFNHLLPPTWWFTLMWTGRMFRLCCVSRRSWFPGHPNGKI